MLQISTSKYRDSFIDEEKKVFMSIWRNNTTNITEQEIKEAVNASAVEIEHWKPLYFIADETDRDFPFSVELQKWIAYTIATACIKAGIKKMALIMPENLIVEMSTEQTVDEAGKLPFELKSFYNLVDAEKWFLAK